MKPTFAADGFGRILVFIRIQLHHYRVKMRLPLKFQQIYLFIFILTALSGAKMPENNQIFSLKRKNKKGSPLHVSAR